MSIIGLFIVGVCFSMVQVLGVGLALQALLMRQGIGRPPGSTWAMLQALALGFYLQAICAIAWQLSGLSYSMAIALLTVAIGLCVIAAALVYARQELRELIAEITLDRTLMWLSLAGFLVGTAALIQFPHVFDSGQNIWTQTVLSSGVATSSSAMLGYSGLVLPLGRFFEQIPLVTVAATYKPLLVMIAGVTACHAVTCLGLRWRTLSSILLLALMLYSQFGIQGLISLGKDSIYGILFSMAFMASLCAPPERRNHLAPALFFVVAGTLGVIAVPYMLMAYALWLSLAPKEERAWETLPAMYAVGLPITPTVIAGFLQLSPPLVFIGYVAAGAVGYLLYQNADFSKLRAMIGTAAPSIGPWLPVGFMVACYFMLPFELAFPVWQNADGSLVTEVRPPLDGKTSFFTLLTEERTQTYTVLGGWIAAAVIGFTPAGRRSAGLLAMAAMPFAILCAALIRLHLKLPLVSDFNVWDLMKDVPLWYGGPLFGLLAIVGAQQIIPQGRALLPTTANVVLAAAVIAVAGCLTAGFLLFNLVKDPRIRLRWVTFTSIGGSQDRDMASLSEAMWHNLRGTTVFVDMRLYTGRKYFYSFSMYEVAPLAFDPSSLPEVLSDPTRRVAFVIGTDAVPPTLAAAEKAGRSARTLWSGKDEAAQLIDVLPRR